jgi:hypothetical protein
MNGNLKIASVRFGSSRKTYDYWIPKNVTLGIGDKAVIENRNGGETVVEVVALKSESDVATKPLLRAAPQEDKDKEKADAGH